MRLVFELDFVALTLVCALVRNAHTKLQKMSSKAFMSKATRLYMYPNIVLGRSQFHLAVAGGWAAKDQS